MNNIAAAFLLSLIAGLSTGIGSLFALFMKKTDMRFLSFSLGLSAGVMIYVSMIELFHESRDYLSEIYGTKVGMTITAAAFFGGMLLIALINQVIPSADKHNERFSAKKDANSFPKKDLMKTGVMTAAAIAIHNFPEGISTFVSSMSNVNIAVPIVVAVAIHNIPEGISVSVPIFFATGSRKKAFLLSFLSGLSEPFGALLAYLVLMPFINDTVFNIILAAVAGIMVFISFDELIPTAQEYGGQKYTVTGLVAGMAAMALSLIILA